MKPSSKYFRNSVTTITLFFLLGVFQVTAQVHNEPSKALVVIDPANKQNIKGYIHIAFAWGEQIAPPQNLLRGLINLKTTLNRWTDIEAVIDNHLYLGSPRLLKMPFVFITTDRAFELTETEKINVKKYLENGGFMVLDNAAPLYEASQGGTSLKQMLREALGSKARFIPIPNDHPLYHCFFDFDDGPPIGSEIGFIKVGQGTPLKNSELALHDGMIRQKDIYFLEGVWIGDRLVAVYSDKGYVVRWKDNLDNEPQLRMGVNMIVYALTQKGGIAQKE